MKNNLQKLREKAGWTEVEFAQILEIDPMFLRRIESGHTRAPIDVARRMAEELGVALRTLFPWTAMSTPVEAPPEANRGDYGPPIVVWSADNVVHRNVVFSFRNGQQLDLSVPQPEVDRVGRILASDREQQNFAVFAAHKHHVILNVAQIMHVMVGADGYRFPVSEDSYFDGVQRQDLPDGYILAFGVDARPAVEIFVEPDPPGDELDTEQPLAFLMADIDMNLGHTSFVFINDMDGDQHILNLDDMSALLMHKGFVGGNFEEFDEEYEDWEEEAGLAQAEARSDEVVNGIDERTPDPK